MLRDLFTKKKRELEDAPPPGDANVRAWADTSDASGRAEADTAEPPREVPDHLWARCNGCGKMLYEKMLVGNKKVCPLCGFHFRLTPEERLDAVFDAGSFTPLPLDIPQPDPLNFPGYKEKLAELQARTGHHDAVLCGTAAAGGYRAVVCIMDSFFMMGSMGYVLGESVTRSVEYAVEHRLPLVIFTASGGARMQEGIISLMQMAKVSGALERMDRAGLLYVTVITNPTTGGVTASFASLGDIILIEPGALIGFTGKRVIEQTIRQKLPKDFQTAEFARSHGFADAVVERKDLSSVLAKIMKMHGVTSDE